MAETAQMMMVSNDRALMRDAGDRVLVSMAELCSRARDSAYTSPMGRTGSSTLPVLPAQLMQAHRHRVECHLQVHPFHAELATLPLDPARSMGTLA